MGRQTSATGPVPQLIDAVAGRDGDRHNILGSLGERNIEQRGQSTTTPDLGTRPLSIRRSILIRVDLEHLQVEFPNLRFFLFCREVKEHDGVKSLSAAEFGWEFRYVVTRGDQVHVRCVIVHPTQQSTE